MATKVRRIPTLELTDEGMNQIQKLQKRLGVDDPLTRDVLGRALNVLEAVVDVTDEDEKTVEIKSPKTQKSFTIRFRD